jgi:hypothetical protein
MLAAWSIVAASLRASDDYGDRSRIARRATVDKSASMASRHKTQQQRSDCCGGANDRMWPIATDDALTANRRFRGIADMNRFSAPDDV